MKYIKDIEKFNGNAKKTSNESLIQNIINISNLINKDGEIDKDGDLTQAAEIRLLLTKEALRRMNR